MEKRIEKYAFITKDTIIAIEAPDKMTAITIFAKEFDMLFETTNWEIRRLMTEINISGEHIRY